MNKKQFLQRLEQSLKKLPAEERRDILADYEEHFAIGMSEGQTEENIVEALGNPGQIGKETLASYHLEKVGTTVTTGNIMRAVWAVIGLGFFNLVVVLGPFIGLSSIVVAGWAVGVAFIASPLLVLADVAISPTTFHWFQCFAAIALCGLGFFISIGMLFTTKAFTKGFIRYLNYNASLVKGGMKREV
ncbi:hypothetical protein GCM10011391_08040 [Pullulanibacillus camelliae]|uniref:DUF1700 domain-containing protein n=1 Tax=Pullulanibacillus camelliae TaxID=1707096 RepID=A0A8J2VID6_9BACL|nr:DUF1700 domain-containing protein [Pullulanibacillus camelliae]GGE31760.1 hypothetical protein GCM10011391_08040 [Pullulanibacillus camelliae]